MKRSLPIIFSGFILASVIAGSCRDDDFGSYSGNPSGDGAIRIGANIADVTNTRSYIEKGPVTSGTFLLTYPYYISGPNVYGEWRYLYHYGKVKFGFLGEETTGFVNVGTDELPKELVWSPTNTSTSSDDGVIVYSSNLSRLYLDNFLYRGVQSTAGLVDSVIAINYPTTTNTYNKEVFENPYKAAIFDSINGSNDLLWGELRTKSGIDLLSFDLSHRMTRFKLNVVVEENNSQDPESEEMTICLDRAKVYLSNILLNPISYKRLYGELLFQKRASATGVEDNISVNPETFQLIKGPDSEPDENGFFYKWIDKQPQENGDTIFTTPDFVFVPQTLPQGQDTRPQIIIEVPAEDVNQGTTPGFEVGPGEEGTKFIRFKGNLPPRMFKDNGPGQTPTTLTLNFYPGQLIEITTKMKPGEMELEFAPVTVQPWVYKGTFYPTARQSGIFNADDLYALIEYYQENNTFWLKRYGYIMPNTDPEKWNFQLNSGSIKFEAAKIVGTMFPNTEVGGSSTPLFQFDFRNRDQFYVMPDGSEVNMGTYSANLYEIVTTPQNTGIHTTGTGANPEENNFKDLISAYQTYTWPLFTFGTYENGMWTFRVTEDITLEYSEVAASMLVDEDVVPDYEFSFETGATVTVLKNPAVSDGDYTVNESELFNIVSKRIPGIYSTADFSSLLLALNNSQTGVLESYGSQVGGTWTFPLQRDLAFAAKTLQGAVASSGITDFAFELNGHTLSLTQADGTTVNNANTPDYLKTILLLPEPEGITSPQSFMELVAAYNKADVTLDELALYGYYCFNSPRWLFFFEEPMTLVAADIEGSMIPDTENGNNRLPFSFNLNYKQIMLEGLESQYPNGITGENGAKTLYELVSTPKPEPDPGTDGN